MTRLGQPDAVEFLERIDPLVHDKARNNLIIGLAGTLVTAPDIYPEHDLFLLEDADRVIAAGLITHPMNMILADAEDRHSDRFAGALVEHGIEMPGAIGNRPTIDAFVHRWAAETGGTASLEMKQGIFALDNVVDVPNPAGTSRPAQPQDRDRILEWLLAFAAEALPQDPLDVSRIEEMVESRLAGEGPAGFWVWELQGDPVAMSGHSGPAGGGIRISAVYTPPELRGRGYATGLVADQSRWLLGLGYQRCFLYTDLTNETSNRIYERIGYYRVAESAMYTFR